MEGRVDEATRLRTPADCTDSQFPVSGFEHFGLGLRLRFRRSRRSL